MALVNLHGKAIYLCVQSHLKQDGNKILAKFPPFQSLFPEIYQNVSTFLHHSGYTKSPEVSLSFSVAVEVCFVLQSSRKQPKTAHALGLSSCDYLFLDDLYALEVKREIANFNKYYSLLIKDCLKSIQHNLASNLGAQF